MYYLYVKTHNQTGLKYLGQTTQNPYVYRGSGKYWTLHLQIHGNDVHTEIDSIHETIESLRERGLELSELYSIVGSPDWANLCLETGDGGDTSSFLTEEGRLRRREKLHGRKYPGRKLSQEHKKKIGEGGRRRKGEKRSLEACMNISRSKIGNKNRTGTNTSLLGRENMRKAALGKKRKPHTEETKIKMRKTWASKKAAYSMLGHQQN